MAIRLIVTFKVQPGKTQEFVEAFAGLAEITHAEGGCEQYQLFTATDEPETVVLLERWTSAEDLDAHMQAMQARGGSPTGQFAAGPPTVERFEID